MPRSLPPHEAAPGGDATSPPAPGREQLRTLVHGLRNRDENVSLYLFHLGSHRLVLQRSNDWITAELERLADAEPEVLKVSVNEWGTDFRLHKLTKS
ncbi:hypothetical protein ABZZ17_38270 [Streptomyces sp. NPDC006512]|uniref:hypothetical protein n=1 Tax=Streptomyces sp. NPDC006512 TaxID=3154307 RepID=UPI0033B9ACB3